MAVTSVLERREGPSFRPFVVPPSLRELGARMRQVRLARGWSQTHLADKMDVAKQTVSNWENGTAPPMLISLVRFCAACNVHMADLLSADGDVVPLPGSAVIEANQVIPLFSLEDAGAVLMQTRKDVKPMRYLTAVAIHPRDALAFTHKGNAMAPRFADGDTVTISPMTMSEPGSLVLAYAGGRLLFRKFLPATEGSVKGARLVAANRDYPDVVMGEKDVILGRMLEHISHSHD